MILISANYIPCSECHIEMVVLGRYGDIGKRCSKCIQKGKGKAWYIKNRDKILKQKTCIRCGKDNPFKNKPRKDICEDCQTEIKIAYIDLQNQKCLYCNKPSKNKKYCSRTCISKTHQLVFGRKHVDKLE